MPDSIRDRILTGTRTEALHRALLAETEAMHALELSGTGTAETLPAGFNIAAWNMERCLFPEASAALLAPHYPGIVLLSEVDHGMSRTGQRNTTAEMAAGLGMHYAYGVEFFELGLGGPTERKFCKDDFNSLGFHGNAILSTVPFERATLIRLDDHGHWFMPGENATDPEQPRLGGRMAVAATVPTEAGPLCVVSTHLESNAGVAHRGAQFDRLMDAVDAFAPDLPVVIGGDLNTGNHLPPDFDWQRETLFDAARARGYHWDLTPEGVTTRASLITPHPSRRMKLDWFCARDVTGQAGPLLASLGPDGTPLSDHECVVAEVRLGQV
ncbi:endonuclease/exonuclease/phosphatase family protein [Pseudoponticoccus marisrubri]|uniref:endonuclease/exonuclease/phosphatase family protein n=1 Tax=Pseudoponticoccus marisrubri TaxID=1685382 RepID=UPI001F0AC9C4|nr:endonuclease/exonuclease/phosphatase family protein [Pseudoponticoccus marisrubri]